MGSSSIIDVVGSVFIGVFLLLAALRMNDEAYQNNFKTQENLTVQENLTALIGLLEHDFARIGYQKGGNFDPNSGCILYGDADSVVFRGDMFNAGVIDTVRWYSPQLSAFTPVLRDRWHCPNPNVRLLIREDSRETIPDTLVFGVTQFSLAYFNTFMQPVDSPYVFPLSDPPPVLVQVTLMVQPTVAYDTAYSKNFAFWTETRLVSRNLKTR